MFQSGTTYLPTDWLKKTPLISKYLSKTFQANEQSPKYSIILHEKQHSYGG
jgi:hypothetical protein